jgi:alpha-beta hydrolase superfamily lysophospholipase
MSGALFFRRTGEPTLRYEVHAPTTAETLGAVLLTHGYAEHSGRYTQVVRALTARGFVVATYDLRGHGNSEGARGYIDRFDDYLRDARGLLTHLADDPAWKQGGKPVLLGHSLGGLITFLLGLEVSHRGAVLSSPFFGLALPVPGIKKAAGRLLSKLAPHVALPSGLKGADVTHDAALARAYDNDPLLVPRVPARWFTEATGAQVTAFERAPTWQEPLLLLQAGADKIASADASRALFERVGSARKELRVLEGQYHEIFNEIDRDRFIQLAVEGAARFCERPS